MGRSNEGVRCGERIYLRTVRRIWAAASAIQAAGGALTLRAIAARAGYRSWSDAHLAMVVLNDAGYVAYHYGTRGTIRVLVPLIADLGPPKTIARRRGRWGNPALGRGAQ